MMQDAAVAYVELGRLDDSFAKALSSTSADLRASLGPIRDQKHQIRSSLDFFRLPLASAQLPE